MSDAHRLLPVYEGLEWKSNKKESEAYVRKFSESCEDSSTYISAEC